MDKPKRTPQQIADELEGIKMWLADLSDEFVEGNNKVAGKETAKLYLQVSLLQERLQEEQDRCKPLTN